MQKNHYYTPAAIALGTTLVIALFLGILPLYFNVFPLTTPDAGGLACAAKTLAKTDHFNVSRTVSPNFAICWTREHYQVVQFINAAILKILPLQSWQTVPTTALFMYLGCVLGIFYIVYQFTRSHTMAMVGGILAAATPALLRSLILTPQNVYGYFVIILLMIVFLHLIAKPRAWYWWISLIGLTPILAFTHTLSFGIAAITFTIWFWLFFLQSWLYRLLLVGVGGIIIFVNEKFSLLPITVKNALQLFQSNFSGYDHPLYDHPAIWGYIVTALAAVGLTLSIKLHYKLRWLCISLIITPVILGHLSYFGLQLLPERFIPFAWLGLVPLAALGLHELGQRLHWRPVLWTSVLILIVSAQIVHAIIFIQDDVNGWSKRFRPHPEFIEALQWLNTQPNKGALLGIMAVSNREISFAPLWYDGMIENYPWYNLDHKNIKNLQANSSLYKPILADPANPEYKRIHALYALMTTPTDSTVPALIAPYSLHYFIVPKTSPVYKIWKAESTIPFSIVYENNKYIIYALL